LTLFVGRQEGHPACKKTEWWGAGVVICLERGADLPSRCHCHSLVSCSSKIQIGFTFLVPAHSGSTGQRAVRRVRVCVCVCVCECGYSALSSRTANALDALVSRVLYCTWSYHFTPIICRWQLMWKDCSLYEIHRGNGLLRGALSGPLWCIRNSRRAPKLLAKSRSCQR